MSSLFETSLNSNVRLDCKMYNNTMTQRQQQHISGTHGRKKRKSKYDVAKIYEGAATKPYFMIQPGDSSFYQHKLRSLNTNGKLLKINILRIDLNT